ncbi:MAG: ABC transporter ATP-binding protein [Bacteroidales bacterium]|nr:ABC transporter ATP-binding protein [Bacteroidales bacterium]
MKDFGPCLKGVWRLLRTVRWKVLFSAFLQTVAAAASLAFVWFSKRVVDIATGHLDAPLGVGIGLLIGIMALQVLTRVFVKYYEGRITVQAKNRIRSDVFDKALRSTWTGKDKFHSADMANRMEEDIRVVTEFICCDIPEAFVTGLQLIAAVVMLFIFSSSLAWILIWIMPVAVVGARLYFRRMRALTTEIRTIDGHINGHLQETLQHRVLVKTLGSVGASQEELEVLQEQELDRTVSRLGYSALSRGFMSVGFSAGYLVAFIWGVLGLKDGTVTYGLMVAFLQMVGQVQRPVANLALYIPAFIRSLSSEERLMEIGEMPQESACADVLLEGTPGVRVSGLSFSYEERGTEVLSDFSFDFKPGQMTVITGPTGEGKSTLAQLLLALLTPTSGTIELYSDRASVPASPATRCNFMYVPQGNSLLSGSVRANLLMAKPSATDEELREVLHLAAADFVFDLPDGLDTSCAEIGRGLSEGQAQRIAIARTLLRSGGILILDEATSALDPDTEQLVLGRIHDHFCQSPAPGSSDTVSGSSDGAPVSSDTVSGSPSSGPVPGSALSKTIICITHRPAAAKLADAHLAL